MGGWEAGGGGQQSRKTAETRKSKQQDISDNVGNKNLNIGEIDEIQGDRNDTKNDVKDYLQREYDEKKQLFCNKRSHKRYN